MDAKTKSKWIRALRSGKYKQTKHVFCDGVGHCCLGVLLDVTKKMGEDRGGPYWERMQTLFGLPPAITTKLAAMNDDDASFSDIADYIKANIPTAPQQSTQPKETTK
jgi:hypothetical protein